MTLRCHDAQLSPERPRLRILHVITHLDMGGAEGVAMTLIDRLRGDIDFGLFAVLRHDPLSDVGQDMAARLDAWTIPYAFGVNGGFKSGGVIVAARALVRMIRRFAPDVVHLHTEIPELTFAVACLLSGRARRAGLLRTVHNGELWIAWNAIGRWVTGRLAHGAAVAVSRHAARADAAIATRRPRPRATIIPNGVARPVPATVLPPHQPAARPFHLLFAGRFVHQKGADLLPAFLAMAYERAADRDVMVTIAGQGALEPAIRQGLAGLCPRWTIGIIPPIEGLSARLADFDAVLLPSRFEGFGLLQLEVLLAGLPLITTSAPGLDELLPPDYPLKAAVDDVAAIGTLIARVIHDPTEARRSVAGHVDGLAQRFGVDVMAQAYAARYATIAEARVA